MWLSTRLRASPVSRGRQRAPDMARPSKILALPEEVHAELDRRLIKRGFNGYRDLAKWLASLGYEISKSAVHEYGADFEERLARLKLATDQAKALVEAAPDDEGSISDALMRLVQEKLFTVLMNFQVDPKKPLNLGSLAKAISELGRATVNQKKWRAEVRAKADTAAAAAAKIGKKAGLTTATVDAIRREILGIAN